MKTGYFKIPMGEGKFPKCYKMRLVGTDTLIPLTKNSIIQISNGLKECLKNLSETLDEDYEKVVEAMVDEYQNDFDGNQLPKIKLEKFSEASCILGQDEVGESERLSVNQTTVKTGSMIVPVPPSNAFKKPIQNQTQHQTILKEKLLSSRK